MMFIINNIIGDCVNNSEHRIIIWRYGFVRSIMTDDFTKCYYCGSTENIEKHHVIHGKIGRKLSTTYHLIVPLCENCHRGRFGVHGKYGYEKDLKLKAEAQEVWEKRRVRKGKSSPESVRDEWLSIFGIDYISEFTDFCNECERDFVTEEDEEVIFQDIYGKIYN